MSPQQLLDALVSTGRQYWTSDPPALDPAKAHAIVLNPRGNHGRALRKWERLLGTSYAKEKGLQDASIFPGICEDDPVALHGELVRWIGGRLRAGARNFVAAGGDGTVHFLLNALFEARRAADPEAGEIRLGAVGLGSSNDFHKPFAQPGRIVEAGVPCRLEFEDAFPHDAGRIEADDAAPFHFLVNASVGATAEGGRRYNQAGPVVRFLKRHWLDAAIALVGVSTLARYRPFPVCIGLDGRLPRTVFLTTLGVVKNVHFGGKLRYDTPQAPDDGRFGVHVCGRVSRLRMFRMFRALGRGCFSAFENTWSGTASVVEVESDSPFSLETDGEMTSARRAVFRILPREVLACP